MRLANQKAELEHAFARKLHEQIQELQAQGDGADSVVQEAMAQLDCEDS